MNWKNESTWAAIGAASVALLAAFGLVTASEGTALTTSIANIITGVIGIIGVVTSIRSRRKADKAEKED